MKRRFPKLASWLAGIYLAWALLVFFGSLGSESHSWWPVFLYPLILPWSLFFNFLPALGDVGFAVLYIVGGTIWIWFLGWVFSFVITLIFPLRGDDTMVQPGGAGNSHRAGQ